MSEFYVYGLVDPRNDEVFYIGKGKGNRYKQHVIEVKVLDQDYSSRTKRHNDSKLYRIQEILDSNNEIKYKFFAKKLSEESAFVLEEELIRRFGRKGMTTGSLLNIMPGGDRDYGDQEEKEMPFEEIRINYPELIPILEKYPVICEVIECKPWWQTKIPKRFALYQYSMEGELLETHHSGAMRYGTGMSSNIIKKCIIENMGYAYGYQWSHELKSQMPNLYELSNEKLSALINYRVWRMKDNIDNEYRLKYERRIQLVEDDETK